MWPLRCYIPDILALILLGVMCACALPSVPEYNDDKFLNLNYRDDSEALPADPRKPVRADGEWKKIKSIYCSCIAIDLSYIVLLFYDWAVT